MKPHRGTLILVLGILGLVVCGFVGIAAWVMANTDLKEMAAGTMDPTGQSTTNAGRICGIIGTVFMILELLAGLGIAIFWGLLALPHMAR